MAEPVQDHYVTLGVSRSASPDELKAAFRKLASQHHPDRNPGDPQAAARFKAVNSAYQVLGDPQRRAMYDRFGHGAEAPGSPFGAGGPFAGGIVDIGDIAIDGILGDLLGAFGVGRGEKGDVKQRIEITFEESAHGCTKELAYDRVVSCVDCRGSGSAPGHLPESCGACGGRGRVRFQQGVFPIAVERTCGTCKGTGKVVRVPCEGCKGAGLRAAKNTLSVTVPPGVESGATRMVTGAGNKPRPDRAAGDLEITILVKPHPFFKRVGDDIFCQVPITFVQATLGGEVEVPTLEGRGTLRVPPGTPTGALLRIRGRGMPHKTGLGRGDQKVEVTVDVPTTVTARQRELLELLAKELGENVSPQRKTFAEKLRELFG
ncbi:MAG: molecular chaperone DnaJ [Polyangiaceae bacterium]